MKAYKCKAGEYCLKAANLKLEDIDLIIGNDFLHPFYFTKYKNDIVLINHHLAHASSAFFPSNFKESAILVADGCGSKDELGQHETITYYYGIDNSIKELKKNYGFSSKPTTLLVENSLGAFYSEVTRELGFGIRNEGKTMGLAPYGNDVLVKDFYQFYRVDNDGNFFQTTDQLMDMKLFIKNILSNKYKEEKFNIMANIAFAIQFHLEEIMIKLANYLYSRYPSKNLCLAGGIFLNSVMNNKILESTPFEKIFIQPAAGDAGTAIGSALYAYHVLQKSPRSDYSPFSPYLGKKYEESEILECLINFKDKIEYEKIDNLYETVAQLLVKKNIIGWFQGSSEIGPRSLGNRSILADPRDKDMKDIINERIKHREHFRPFAPIVLMDYQKEYFSTSHPSYYMLLVSYIYEESQKKIPAVSHVDGTGRIQTVNKEFNEKLYHLLKEFHKITNVPVLLNTSFNDNGEPIVESPSDALNCFLNIDLDYLIIEDYLIKKL